MKEEFNELADQWEQETWMHSFWHNVNEHPAYLKIKEMGQDAVPLIVERMKAGGGSAFWCAALTEITGQNPAKHLMQEDHGFITFDVEDVINAWIQWYKSDETI